MTVVKTKKNFVLYQNTGKGLAMTNKLKGLLAFIYKAKLSKREKCLKIK